MQIGIHINHLIDFMFFGLGFINVSHKNRKLIQLKKILLMMLMIHIVTQTKVSVSQSVKSHLYCMHKYLSTRVLRNE